MVILEGGYQHLIDFGYVLFCWLKKENMNLNFYWVLFVCSISLISCKEETIKPSMQEPMGCEGVLDSVTKYAENHNILELRKFARYAFEYCYEDYGILYMTIGQIKFHDREAFIPYWKMTKSCAKSREQYERLYLTLADFLGQDSLSKEASVLVNHFIENPPKVTSRNLAYLYHEVGLILYYSGRPAEALPYQMIGLEWLDSIGEEPRYNVFYSNVFFSALELRDFELCERVMKKGELNFEAKLDSVRRITSSY